MMNSDYHYLGDDDDDDEGDDDDDKVDNDDFQGYAAAVHSDSHPHSAKDIFR